MTLYWPMYQRGVYKLKNHYYCILKDSRTGVEFFYVLNVSHYNVIYINLDYFKLPHCINYMF
jgi:hypothetical protein